MTDKTPEQCVDIVNRLEKRMGEISEKANHNDVWRHGWDDETFTAIDIELKKIRGDML